MNTSLTLLRWFWITVAVLVGSALLGHGAHAQEAEADEGLVVGSAPTDAAVSLKVATKPLEPFVFVESDGSVSGFSVDVWNEIASRLGLETEWVIHDSVSGIIAAAESSEVDLAIAGISMTPEREATIDFSYPYFSSGLRVATRTGAKKGTAEAMLDLATSSAVVVPVIGLVGLVVLISHLVWLGERRSNPQFPESYREGIGEALWWSTVSVITGGEAVKEINRPLSRVLAIMWMLVGLVLLAYVTAQAASSLTLRELQGDITGIDDLSGEVVGTVQATVAASYLADANLASTGYESIDDALNALDIGAVDAVVYDDPVLAYRATTDYRNRLELVGLRFARDPYAIALPADSHLREQINSAILEMSRDGTIDELLARWFGQSG